MDTLSGVAALRRAAAPGHPQGVFLDDGLRLTLVADGVAWTVELTPTEAGVLALGLWEQATRHAATHLETARPEGSA